MIDIVISKEIYQVFSALQNHDYTMNILSNDDDSLSFQNFSESEENIDDVQSSLKENIDDIQSLLKINSNFVNNEEMFEINEFDDTFIENKKLNDQKN
jgi:hypothetical protein